MKLENFFIGLGIVIGMLILGLGIYGYMQKASADKFTLTQIADKINASSDLDMVITDGKKKIASAIDGKSLTITVNGDKQVYTLKDGILTNVIVSDAILAADEEGTISTDEMDDAELKEQGIFMTKVMAQSLVVDCIGQLHGHKAGDTYNTLNSEEIKSYKISQGVEVVVSGNKATTKIDINKKLELVKE